MRKVINISETCQDLFAYNVHEVVKPNTVGYWVDFGARNWGAGFGQNNTTLLYNNGWSGLSMDIGNYKETYVHLDQSRVHFEQIDCTNVSKMWDLFEKIKVPHQVNYLNFDIDEGTERGLITLESFLEANYTFDSITIEHDSYRFGVRVRDLQRDLLDRYGYVMVAELDLYEDWWIHQSIYSSKFEILKEISDIKHEGGFNSDKLSLLQRIVASIVE